MRIVVAHMFSKKALGYRAFTISWTFFAVALWNYIYFREFAFSESLEITATIVIGKFIFYGLWEYHHLKEVNLAAVYDVENHKPLEVLLVAVDESGQTHVESLEDHPPGHA
jgi:hypothetical protein